MIFHWPPSLPLQIVIHASGMVGAILEEELGSGYFDLQATSGSGWMEPNGDASDTTYMDDEDFASHKVEIDVECRVPRSDTSGSDQVGLIVILPVYLLYTPPTTKVFLFFFKGVCVFGGGVYWNQCLPM